MLLLLLLLPLLLSEMLLALLLSLILSMGTLLWLPDIADGCAIFCSSLFGFPSSAYLP